MRLPLPHAALVLLVAAAVLENRAAETNPARPPEPPATALRLNSIGYLPASPKQATVATNTAAPFRVLRRPSDVEVLQGTTTPLHDEINPGLALADFSALHEPGEYQLDIPGLGRSAVFRIDADLYRRPFEVVTRAMYLWRCGTAVSATHDGVTFGHAACHTNDTLLDLAENSPGRRAARGGWHDAGDYNLYVVNAGVTVGSMLRAWEDFPRAIARASHGLTDVPRNPTPETAPSAATEPPLPAFLAEIRWELDWLLSMQRTNGAVYHKLSTRKFGGMILPEHETADRYFAPWGTAATADFVAMLAQAARCFRPFQPQFADRCLAAARRSYAFLVDQPQSHRPDLREFSTGAYQTGDGDDRLWAAAELWTSTGDAPALADCEQRLKAAEARVDVDFDWGNVHNLGVITYLAASRPGRDASLMERLRRNLVDAADTIVSTRDAHAYARPLGRRQYWGCNGSVARQCLVLQAAWRIHAKPEFRTAQLDALNHLLGRNVHGRSYLTGLGFAPPRHPHDRRSAGDQVEAPWPGYLVGGPHPRPTDWFDHQDDYRTNEIAINWNGALLYALASALPDA